MKLIDSIASRLGFERSGHAKHGRRDFNAAANTRLTGGWNSVNTSANVDLFRGLDTLRARSRDLCQNNDYARRFLGLVTANVVGGAGVMLQARIYDAPDKPDTGANNAVESAWAKWGERGQCDVTGLLSWRDIQLLAIRTVARDGECLIRKVRGKAAGNGIGYALQVVDIDRLDTKLVRAAQNNINEIKMGVEVDGFGRPIAYWLRPYHPGELWLSQGQVLSQHQRVPAADILHIYMVERPEQLRGTPWMHAAMIQLQNLGGYEEAAVIAARVGASKMGFFTSPDGMPQADGEDAQGVPFTEAEPGSFGTLPEGYGFTPFNPDYPHAMYDSFTRACLRGVASGLGVSYHGLANDLTQVNFSSIRAGTLEERDQWISVQQWFIDCLIEPIYRDFIESALAFGQVTLENGSALPLTKLTKLAAHTWQARRWQWVDPLKDMEANVLAIQNGLKAPQDIAAELGVDYEDVLVKIKQAQDLQEKIGVKLFDPNAKKPDTAMQQQDATKSLLDDMRQGMRAEIAVLSAGLAATQAAHSSNAATPQTLRVQVSNGATLEEIRDAMPITINVPEAPAPVVTVNVAAPVVNVAAPEVTFEATLPAPNITVDAVLEMPTRKTISEIDRNSNQDIVRVTQTETTLKE